MEASWQKAATEDGQTFVYRTTGDGPLVVLLHGFPDTPHSWGRIAAALADAGYRAMTPWLRGYHPDNIVPGRPYDPVSISEDAVTLLDAIEAENAILAGHDWGAVIAYGAVSLHPERFRAIVPIAIPYPRLYPRSLRLAWEARHFLAHRLPWAERSARRGNFRHLDRLYSRWSPNWHGPERDRSLADVKECFRDRPCLSGALAYYRDFSPAKAEELPEPPAVPALAVGGSGDFDLGLYPKTAELFGPGSDALVIEGAGHWPHREAEDVFIARLIEFADRLEEPAAA